MAEPRQSQGTHQGERGIEPAGKAFRAVDAQG